MALQIPAHENQTEFNLKRWDEVLVDPRLSRIEGRVETDRHGNIVVMLPPGFSHGSRQMEIGGLIRQMAEWSRNAQSRRQTASKDSMSLG
ncbi:MAG: Uma2 family endonuclease [Verrucomicrobiales bacterium]|jgi:Uma2 family endonuclease